MLAADVVVVKDLIRSKLLVAVDHCVVIGENGLIGVDQFSVED